MRTQLFSWLVLCSLAFVFATSSVRAAQEKIAGKIIAAKVHGTVTALNKADNSSKVLHDSDALSEGYVVTTGQKSSVVLLFANGSAVNLSADSTLSIDEFLLDPFDAKYSAAEAKEEPSTSVTTLSLQRGELVGNVKHLHRDQGSAFTVNTPVGAAGIRGTTFQFALGTDDSGKPYVRFSTSEGTVYLTALDGAERLIPAGKSVNITFETTTSPTGVQTIVPGSVKVSDVGDIPLAVQAVIAQAVQAIIQANPALINPTTTPTSPNATTPPVNTTPGDGNGG
jgi:hypothetical protein